MADFKLKADTAVQTVIASSVSAVAASVRIAGDYDNAASLDPIATAYLTYKYTGAAPAAGALAAELYLVPGNSSALVAEGGDALRGTNDQPQAALLVGVFQTVNPSTSVNETLAVRGVPLHPKLNRFVLQNRSGQSFAAGLTLRIEPEKSQSV